MTAAAAVVVVVAAAAVVVVVVVVVVVAVVAAAAVAVAAVDVHDAQKLGDEHGEAAGVPGDENAVAFVGERDGEAVAVVVVVGLDGDGADVDVDCGENCESGLVGNDHGNSAENVRAHSHCGTALGMCRMHKVLGTNRIQISDDVLAHMAAH